jgi:hypothetical protein
MRLKLGKQILIIQMKLDTIASLDLDPIHGRDLLRRILTTRLETIIAIPT